MSTKANSGKGVLLEMHHVRNYEQVSCIDSSLQWYNENEDCVEAVVEQIATKRQKTSEDQESNEGNTTERE
jgi:hypothetical protein